jgi:hypothetical protein
VVDEHPHGEIRVFAGLHLDVDQHPLFSSAFQPNLDQLVDEAPPNFRLSHNLLEFLVQRLGAPAPVDIGMRLGEE